MMTTTALAQTDEKLPLSIFKPDPENPREIGAGALAGLSVSLEEFGDLSGIVWNQQTGELVCGHQRIDALAKAGAASWTRTSDTEGYIVHPETGERFRVRIVDWDPMRQRMANLVANNPEISGRYTEAAFDQIRSLEQDPQFAALNFPELEARLDKEIKRAEEETKKTEEPPPSLPEQYLVMVTCSTDKQQAALLEELAGRGLKVRALIQ